MIKRLAKDVINFAGLEVRRVRPAKSLAIGLPDAELYQPYLSPWKSSTFAELYRKIQPYTLVRPESCYVLKTLAETAKRLSGEFWECGVYRGGTAMLLAQLLRGGNNKLRLFDTFQGMPETDPERDRHKKGDFADTTLEGVQARIADPSVSFHQGLMPDTFKGLEQTRIALAHIDVDIYDSVLSCCKFIYPRLQPGGFMLFDDYGLPSCPGARAALDKFSSDEGSPVLALASGQAIIFGGEAAI